MSEDITTKSSTGLDANVAGLLCYLVGWISGLVFFLIEKESRFVRFHAMQSILMSGSLMIISWVLGQIPFVGWIISILLALVQLALWITLMFKAFKGEWFKLPVIGDIAETQANKLAL